MPDKSEVLAKLADLGVTMTAEFVPFSQSRNAAEKHPSLNWNVTIHKGGRVVLTTDYGAGMAHCPAYSRKAPNNYDRLKKYWRDEACRAECEAGFAIGRVMGFWPHHGDGAGQRFRFDKKTPILPDLADVMHCLVLDASVLDCGGFENWAADFGYDTDSRKAEATYRQCLDLAVKMRAAFGDAGMAEMSTLFQDY